MHTAYIATHAKPVIRGEGDDRYPALAGGSTGLTHGQESTEVTGFDFVGDCDNEAF